MRGRSTGGLRAGFARWPRLAALLVLLLALAAPATAKVHAVAPGEVPVLEPGEGLLLLAVDTDLRLTVVNVNPEGSSSAIVKLGRTAPWYNARLFVVPAGAYHWGQIDTTFNTRLTLKDNPEYRFKVEAGKVTYPGDLVYRWTGLYWADIQLRNRSLRAMDWLETTHPALARQHGFAFSGHYPDPFPDFYRTARATSGRTPADLSAVDAPPPVARALPLSPRELWRDDRVTHVELNPAGDLLAEASQLDETQWAIDLIDLKAGSAVRLANSPAAIRSMQWSGNRTLLAGMSKTIGAEVVTVFHIRDGEAGKRAFDAVHLDPLGNVLSTIVDDPAHILYKEEQRTLVYKRDISSRSAINGSKGTALNHHIKNDVAWWPDGRGRLRFVQAESDDGYALWYGEGEDSFKYLMDLDGDFVPQAASFEGNVLYAISDQERAQRELVEFDPALKRITRTLFSKPGVDVVSALFDARQKPIGVTYFQEGRSVSEYFDAQDAALTALLQRTFPGSTVSIVSRSRDNSQLVLQVEASDQPPRLYHLDVAHRQASLLDSQRPWLDGKPLAPSQVIKATSSDGLPIEAYLTLPPGAGKRPLVVLPHGGPVGVSDRLLFDPESQFFASLGYAVLRVNFRGSDGYGKAFREAGHNAQGTRIEDDIDVAITQALARYPLDPDRMCIVGSSYGGYSALVSTMRWPHRFKCAVSVSGVSDRLLGFTATDGAQSESGRKELESIFGDPVKEHDAMLARSPIYHYQDLQVPLMLVHGKEDMRVDYEHARRLVRLLNLAGHRPVMLTFDQGGHGWKDIDEIDKAYTGIAGFLQQHLDTATSAAGVTTTAKAP